MVTELLKRTFDDGTPKVTAQCVTNKYDQNENKKKNTFQLYQNKGNGYFSIDIYYTIEEYNYRPSHYTIVMLINRVLTLYSIIISIFIFLIYFSNWVAQV